MAAWAGLASVAHAADVSAPAILQLFEASYKTIERRAPDLFMAGYGGLWTPPPGRADQSNFSVGYDVYDRFDLGYAGNPTLYGTETGLKTTVSEVHKIGASVYTDLVWNHNGFTDNDNAGFQQAGGYPGFVVNRAGDADGDFHPQSSTGDYYGRISGLIDIAHEKNYQYIRNPVPGFANNIPAGTTPLYGRLANVPTEANRRFYPDLQGPSTTVNGVTYHHWNGADPSTGDPVAENATGYLMRHTRWMVEEIGVDGFRLDATKHMTDWSSSNPDWVLEYYDISTNAGKGMMLDGVTRKRVFGFGEYLDTNIGSVQATIKKGANANRDALDFAMHYALKNNLSGNGVANDWRNVVNDSQDRGDDGLANNGSQGVAFDASHDDGGAHLGNVANAYLLMRPGNAVVYMNAKEFGNGRDFPKDGRGDALGGFHGNTITKLVDIRNTHGRGNYAERWIDKETLVFERQTSAIAAYNNRLDDGSDQRTVNTSFTPGVHLVELTGNATNTTVDPSNNISDTVVVQPNGQITIRIPRNKTGTVEHGKGYVIYGLQNPKGGVSVSNVARTIAGETATAANNGTVRLSSVDVIKANSFNFTLNTNAVTLSDGWRDFDADGDNAVLRVDAGLNVNGNANVDYRAPGSVSYGFEDFVTTKTPGYGSPTGNGTYVQTIDATQLAEGYHYLTARAFRHRATQNEQLVGEAVYTDFRKVVYVDRARPVSAIAELKPFGTDDRDVIVKSLDKTATGVHVFHNIGASQFTDAQLTSMATGGQNPSGGYDRDLFKYGISNMKNGNHAFTVVTFEMSYDPALGFAGGGVNVQRFAGYGFAAGGGQGFGDLDFNGATNATDINTFDAILKSNNTQYNPAGELNGDGVVNLADTFLLGPRLSAVNATQATWDRYNTMIHSTFVKAGTYTVDANHDVYEDTAAVTNVNAGAQLTASYVRGTTLNVAAGGVARIRANGTDGGVSRLTNVNVTPGGVLDLTDNDLIVDYAAGAPHPISQLRADLAAGRITSSTAGEDKVLAVVDNAEWGRSSFAGQSIDTTTIVGKFTYFGDANLDGRVTGDDYVSVDANLGSGNSWLEGDFNMSGVTTGDDYVAIDANLGKGTTNPLAYEALKAEMVALHVEMFGEQYLAKLAAAETGGFQIVPEPAGGLLLGGLLSALLLRRTPAASNHNLSVSPVASGSARATGCAEAYIRLPQATLQEVPHVS